MQDASGSIKSEGGKRSTDPLERPLNSRVLDELFASGCISAAARDAATALLCDPQDWWRWTSRLLVSLGTALVFAGVVFFFASNWAAMGSFLKFAVLETALVAALAGVWVAGLEGLAGKLLLSGASLCVGVLLAVYGQVYQTGADAFELFLGWSLLILGWVLLSRFIPLWLLWLVLLNLALGFYWEQVAVPNGIARGWSLYSWLALLDGVALVAREALVRRHRWIGGIWLRWVLLASVLTWLTIPTVLLIVGVGRGTPAAYLAAGAFATVLAGSYWYYRHRSPDLLSLTMGILAFSVVALTGVGRVLFDTSDAAGMFLLFGFIVLGFMSSLAFWLASIGRDMEGNA